MTSAQQAVPKLDTPLVEDSIGTTDSGMAVRVKGGIISIPWYRFLISLWQRTGGGTGTLGVSSGSMFIWPGDPGALPDGTFLCDGTAISRTQYSTLFSIIGVKFGAGDGFSTFNLPDLRDRVIMGASASKPYASTGGNSSIELTIGQLPEFTPVVLDPMHVHGVDDPEHHHGQEGASNNTAGTTGTQLGTAADAVTVGQTADAATGITIQPAATGITIEPIGGGLPIDITPSYLALAWVIQT